MSILLVTWKAPDNPFDGGDLRRWNLLEGQADILCFASAGDPTEPASKPTRLPWRQVNSLKPSAAICRISRWSNKPAAFARRHSALAEQIHHAIEEYCRKCEGTRLIIADHALALLLIPNLRTPFIFDATDSMALYYLRRAKALAGVHPLRALNSLAWFRVYRAVEANIAQHAALYVVPAEADRRCVIAGLPGGRVWALPNGTRWTQQPTIEPRGSASAPVIAFHGGMTWEPNRSSAVYLAKKVFPLVRHSIPQARLRIAGAPVTSELLALAQEPGVEVVGFVPDLRAWLSECTVYAMPMTQGSGVKNKLLEGMAAGLPIVTNSLGAEALPRRYQRGLVVANGRHAQAREITHLIRNPSANMGLRTTARRIAIDEFGWTALAARYRKAVMDGVWDQEESDLYSLYANVTAAGRPRPLATAFQHKGVIDGAE